MNEKTLTIIALAVGAFMLARPAQARAIAGNAAQRFFANSNQSVARAQPNPAIYQANDSKMWGDVGQILGKVIPKFTTSSIPNDYQKANAANSGARPQAADNGDPYASITSMDGIPANPAPGFSDVYDYTNESWF